MRRHLGLITTFSLALLILIALGIAGNVELYRDNETELTPNRSSFNAGPTGTRALYQLLEESDQRVSRWRESFRTLKDKAPNGIFVLVGPYANRRDMEQADADALREWILEGGQALIISREPYEQLGSLALRSNLPQTLPDWNKPIEQAINPKSDGFIGQPTRITRDLRGLALSEYASRLLLPGQEVKKNDEKPAAEATPTASPTPTATPEEAEESETAIELLEQSGTMVLPAPVVHLGDEEGAVLADYDYGKGRLVVLTDPFIVANHGLARGANLQLMLNVLRELGAGERLILFDEYHHGYRSETNALIGYFRGTPFWWVLGQILLLGGLVIYSLGKRFARPLPLPQADRHSPLEFVSSMASLQQAAEAHDLALENIYPKFKARLCRRLGLSVRAQAEDIIKALRNNVRLAPHAERLAHIIITSEQTLKGATLTDAQLVELVSAIRHLNAEIK
jgi:hypothetical protein